MISVRGPDRILVVDRTAVPVSTVCDAVTTSKSVGDIINCLPITEQEVFAAVDAVVSLNSISDRDYIRFQCDREQDEVSVDTVAVTDTVYLNALIFGKEQRPTEQDLYTLYAYGIESIMFDCLLDISNGDCYYKNSDLHSMVYESFCQAFGKPSQEEVQGLLNSLIDEGISK